VTYKVSVPASGQAKRVTASTLDLQKAPNGWSEKGGTGQCAGATTSYSCTGNLESDTDRVVLVATPSRSSSGRAL